MGQLATLTFPITKRREQADGSVIVEGPVTDESLDLDGQIVDGASAAKALQAWFDEWGNLRQQHSPILPPAGTAIDFKFKNGVPWIKGHVVDTNAVKLVKAGVYKAFSVGIADGKLDTSPAARKRAPNGILFPSLVNEISLVDYPANVGMGKFCIAKRAKHGAIVPVGRNRLFDERLIGLSGDSLVTAAKGLYAGAVVHTAATPEEAAALVGTQFDANQYEAKGNVIVMKRDFDRGVGEHGTDRDKIPAKDFAGPNRTYPIVSPGDVSDAASLIGKADNPDKVKAKIIRIAQRKGPQFVAELPKKWRKEMGNAAEAAKAAGSDKPFPGAAAPFGSKENETPEEKAARKARKKAKRAKKAAKAAQAMEDDKHLTADMLNDPKDDGDDTDKAAKSKVPEIDQKVTDDLKDADDAVSQAKEDQAKDNDRHERGDDDDDPDDADKGTKGSKKKLKKAAQRLAKEAQKAREAKAAEVASAMKRAHDVLCPLYKKSVTASLTSPVEAIDPNFFRDRLLATGEDEVETYAARKGAYDAASQIATIKLPDFNALRKAAHKAFTDAYPNLKIASPDLEDPASFQRGFLPSANSEVATATSKPGNFVEDKPLEAADFTRGPLVANEARPSLVGGVSAASMQKGRLFYTNAAKDESAAAMASLHDHIVSNYPTVCPGLGNEATDRLGTPPEMYSPASGTTGVGTGGMALNGVSADVTLAATKRADEFAKLEARFTKQAKKIAKLERKLGEALARPDYTKSARRQTDFAPTHADVTPIAEGKRARLERAQELSKRIHDRHSPTPLEDVLELQELGVTPQEFGALMVADETE